MTINEYFIENSWQTQLDWTEIGQNALQNDARTLNCIWKRIKEIEKQGRGDMFQKKRHEVTPQSTVQAG